ncbi:MAG: hypothetical protein QOH67_1500, partial [Hyphomicrobiales bacterium]|nr:hypothetical protein [Hyphomicrobiales bacterium]
MLSIVLIVPFDVFERMPSFRLSCETWVSYAALMAEPEAEPVDVESLAKRRVPCLLTYLSPFRMIDAKGLTSWNITIEHVNQRTWDYAALHEVVGGLDVGLPNPYHLVLARDGALALPPIAPINSHQAAVEFFNRTLAALLLGGIYCEAITPDGLDTGSIIDWKYVRSHRAGLAAPNRFHEQIRYGKASALEAISLYRPPTVALDALRTAMKIGLDVLDRGAAHARRVPSQGHYWYRAERLGRCAI